MAYLLTRVLRECFVMETTCAFCFFILANIEHDKAFLVGNGTGLALNYVTLPLNTVNTF